MCVSVVWQSEEILTAHKGGCGAIRGLLSRGDRRLEQSEAEDDE